MASTIIVLNTGFNVEYWNRYSLEDFLSEALASKFFKEYPLEKRKELLVITYNLIRGT
jgi:hypothetical protein